MIELLSIPAILALVEAVKKAGMPSKLAPVLAILAGLSFGTIMGDPVMGIVYGLSASGVYSGARKMLQ
jgi:hypothetical protein